MSRTDHSELLKRAATFVGELLIDNRIDAEQIDDAKALHDDLMAAVQGQAAVADAVIEGIPDRERQLAAELENSLYARCESCCKGLEHDDGHCGAPTARRRLIGLGKIKPTRRKH